MEYIIYESEPGNFQCKSITMTDAAFTAVSSEDMSAAVKGFVVASDKDLLLSGAIDTIKGHQCSVCGMAFALARVRETHEILEHQIPAPWKCDKCGVRFIHAAIFHLHMINCHFISPLMCAIKGCSAVFYNKTMFTYHKNQHQLQIDASEGMSKDKFMYQCPFCPKEFPQQCRLVYHMRQHTGELPYKCSICSKGFKLSSERTKHVREIHNRVRNHLCTICGQKFFSITILNQHILSHSGVKPHVCSVCSRGFSKPYSLRVHMRQHTGEKPNVCELCGQSFTVRVSLRTHLKSKHGIIVDTSMYRRPEEPDSAGIPPIGRPKQNGFKVSVKTE